MFNASIIHCMQRRFLLEKTKGSLIAVSKRSWCSQEDCERCNAGKKHCWNEFLPYAYGYAAVVSFIYGFNTIMDHKKNLKKDDSQ